VKHAIWLVNSRAGSGYPARGIKMPLRDFRGILEMWLFHCSYFIKQLPFPCSIAWSMHLECCSTFGKRKNTLACGSSIFYAFRKSCDIPRAWNTQSCTEKPFGIPLMPMGNILCIYSSMVHFNLPFNLPSIFFNLSSRLCNFAVIFSPRFCVLTIIWLSVRQKS
jgi:hypothetical protein